ncbi:hypothetical protein QTH97_19250 [Variovorax sp. J22R24]|uniref:hypothetical protein n=1 Tax=Variovorax gracilis TaxID=3053502 RepID=UPI0025782508|nr:hypothetical protein [Variovorax sp. J22R24]MDM0107090.1 hypothetical protein [Variovorax sp. J22R24]
MTRLQRAVVMSRLAVDTARGDLIEALGDWMCGGERAPPSPEEIAELARLVDAQEQAEADYARRVAALSEEWVTRARRRTS